MKNFLGRATWRLGLGTYQLGAKTEDVVKNALRIGYRHIDTAALYRNEAAVASAIAASGVPRGDICVATKIHVRDMRRLTIRQATENALKNLGEIDLLMLHNWHPNAPEAWALLNEELTAGRVGAIGVSNFGVADIAALQGPLPAVNQIELSPFQQRAPIRTFCDDLGIEVAAHSPLTKAKRFGDLAAVANPLTAPEFMLAWSLQNAACSLPRSANPEHLRENFRAQDIALTPTQLDKVRLLEDGFATHPRALR